MRSGERATNHQDIPWGLPGGAESAPDARERLGQQSGRLRDVREHNLQPTWMRTLRSAQQPACLLDVPAAAEQASSGGIRQRLGIGRICMMAAMGSGHQAAPGQRTEVLVMGGGTLWVAQAGDCGLAVTSTQIYDA